MKNIRTLPFLNCDVLNTCYLINYKILLLIIIPVLFASCQNTGKTSVISSFSEDSVRINSIYEEYKNLIATNYDSSRVLLETIYDEINSLPAERENLSIQFFSFIAVSEAIAGNLNVADSLTKASLVKAYRIKDHEYFDVAHHNRGIYYYFINEYDSCKMHIGKAIKWAESSNDIDQLISAKANLTLINERNETSENIILKRIELAELCERHEKWQYLGDLYNNIGELLFRDNHLNSALDFFTRSLETYATIDSKHNSLAPQNNTAVIYHKLGMDSLALEAFKEVRQIAKSSNNYDIYAASSSQIADIYLNNQKPEKAKKIAFEIIEFFDTTRYPISHGYIDGIATLGTYYSINADLHLAKKHYKNALKLAEKNGDMDMFIKSGYHLSDVYLKENKLDSVKCLCFNLLDSAIKYNYNERVADLSYQCARLETKAGRSANAIKYYELYKDYSSKIIDTLTTQQAKDVAYLRLLNEKENEKKSLENEYYINEAQLDTQRERSRSRLILLFSSILVIILLVIILFTVKHELKIRKNSNEALVKQNNFKNKLISIISHDLRSPIVEMQHAFFLLTRKKVPEDKRTSIEKSVLDRSKSTLDLIDNILFWTRNQLNGYESIPEEFNLFEVVNNIYENQLNSRIIFDLELRNTIDSELLIFADLHIVKLALRNLLANAIKFTPNKGTITVAYTIRDKEHVFSISDTGQGIKKEEIPLILDDSKTFTSQGLHGEQGKGIGLSLCKYFIEKAGGRIWLESVIDIGTTFHFTLPAIKANLVGSKNPIGTNRLASISK